MEDFSNFYTTFEFDNSDLSSPTEKSSSHSDFSNFCTTTLYSKASDSDEHVMLASSNPKKRAGRKKFRETRHPVFRGVRKRDSGKWVSEVRQPNNKCRIWLGTYQTADMAARAHDVAVLALRGKSACLNFADSTWRLPIPASADVKDIQRDAAEAAEMFGPFQVSDVVSQDYLVIDESEMSSLPGNAFYDLVIDESEMSSLPENVFYNDDAFSGMPELLANMAEGLMLPPPNCARNEFGADDIIADMSLWNYSN